MEETNFNPRTDLTELKDSVDRVRAEVKKIIVGQDKTIDMMIAAVLADGHVLIEGVPGIAKTLLAKIIARTVSADFSRIQFTPDLMPSDILGTSVFNVKTSEFEFNRGPIFSNIILIDEIENAGIKKEKAIEILVEENKIVLMVTHDPSLALNASKRIVIKNGGIDKVLKATEKEKNIAQYLNWIEGDSLKIREKIREGKRIEKVEIYCRSIN